MKKYLASIRDNFGKQEHSFLLVVIAIGLVAYTLIAKDFANSALDMAGNGWGGGYFLLFISYPFIAILILVGAKLWLGALIFAVISACRRDFLPIMLWLASATSSYLLYGWIWPEEQTKVETQNEQPPRSRIYSVNYWPDRTQKYVLSDLSTETEKQVTGEATALSQNGGPACCLVLPAEWLPGIKLKLDWWDADHEKADGKIHTMELELPTYEHSGDIYIVFYRQHEAEIFVSAVAPGETGWPGRIKQSPWDFCVAERGRKACMLGMPFSEQRLSDFRGRCTLEDTPGDMSACGYILRECIQYYEDADFCKSLVWEPRKQ